MKTRLTALAAVLCGLMAASHVAAQVEALETPYLRLVFNARLGTFTVLSVDVEGGGRHGPNLLAGPGHGLHVTSRPADGVWTSPTDGASIETERRDSADGPSLLIKGLSHGPGVTEVQRVTLARDAHTISLRRQIRVERNGSYLTLGQVRLALEPAATGPTIYFGGRHGMASGTVVGPGELTDPNLAFAGAVSKDGGASFAITSEASLQSSVVRDAEGTCAAGLSVWDSGADGTPHPVSAGEIYQHAVTITFAPQGVSEWALLKATTSRFDPEAEEFVFWCSHIGTTRPFGGRRLQATAAVIDPGLPEAIINAYQFCWLRDVAHGWKSGAYVAGPATLRVMRDEIEAFAGRLNDRGWAPTYLGAHGEISHGNLDGMGLLIGMIYDYVSKTGDFGFLQAMLPAARRCAWAVLALQGPRGLPVVGADGDTYPDLGFIKGEQTYLAAVCYDGLSKMAALCSVLDLGDEAARWRAAADRIKAAANKAVADGGLWNPVRGAYVGWRDPDGSVYENEESFANLIAVHSGLCDDPDRIEAIFRRLNADFQRYYLDGLCPTAHSVAPYPNGLNQWCPWIAGWDLLARVAHDAPRTAEVLGRYLADYAACDYPFQEAVGYEQEQASAGNRGRIWDSWGLLAIIYGAHYGVSMRPANLRISPKPLKALERDGIRNLRWQQARLDVVIEGEGREVSAVTLMGAGWPSSVLPKLSGRAGVRVTMGAGDGPLFLLDASPEAEVLGARQESPTRLALAVRVPSAGPTRYVVRCPQGTVRVGVEVSEPAAAEVAYDAKRSRATVTVNAPKGMRLHLTVEAEPASPSA